MLGIDGYEGGGAHAARASRDELAEVDCVYGVVHDLRETGHVNGPSLVP